MYAFFSLLLLEYLLFSIHAHTIYIHIHIPLANLCSHLYLIFLLVGFNLDVPSYIQVVKMGLRIHQWTILFGVGNAVVDFLGLCFCTSRFGMYYFFVGLVPNFCISIVFVELAPSIILVTFCYRHVLYLLSHGSKLTSKILISEFC